MKRRSISIGEKKRILAEAFHAADINAVLDRYKVHKCQLDRWRNQDLDSVNEERKTVHKGRASVTPDHVWDNLSLRFEFLRDNGRPVSVNDLVMLYSVELPAHNASSQALTMRVRRFMKKNDMVIRRVTHVPQNTRPVSDVAED